MSRVIAAFAQFFDDQGDPVENGWLRFLVSATNNTDKETYSDANQTVANANPLQLDAAGRAPNVFGQGKYRVVLFENNPVTGLPGSQLAEFDPVFAQVITQSAGENFSEWNVDVTYEVGSIVSYQHSYYRSFTSGNLGNFPDSNPTEWEQISFLRYYNPSVSYYTDDIVVYNSQFYFSLADANQGNQPDISPAWWDALGSGTILTNWEENGTDFRPTTAGYNIGDAVNYVGTMYLETFGIFPETPAALPTADYEIANKLYVDTLRDDVMKWQSDWSPGTYETYDVVRDEQWTMIANTTTEERPAPQPVGDATWVRDEYSPPAFSSTSASENVLYIGQRYLYNPAFLTTNIRVYFPTGAVGLNVELWAVIDPTGDLRILNLVPGQNLTSATVDKWIELPLGQVFVPENTEIDFILVIRPSTGDTTFTHEWVYSKSNGDPGAGEIYHQGGTIANQMRVHEQDNTLTDRTSELDNIGPGSTIHMATPDYTWEVLQASKTGDIYTFTVSPAARSANATTDFTFQYFGTTAINYVYNTDLFASESRISGYFANEYDPTNATYIDNNGYGIDIQIQNVITSSDWEIVASPPGYGSIGSSGGGGTGLSYWEEAGDIFRPITTKIGQLGDSTHLIESAYFMDSGIVYLGDSQDLEIFHDGTDSWLENNTGDLYLQNSSANSIFLIANSNSWEIASNGDIIPDTTGAYDFGSTSFRIDKGWFTSLEITNTPTINGDDFITTVLPSQVGHTGEYLQTDGAGNLSWAAAGGGSGLVYWEEIIEVLRPITTKDGSLGDSTHLIENLYIMESGWAMFGDAQETQVGYDGDAFFYTSAGDLYIQNDSANSIFFSVNSPPNGWRIESTGDFWPTTDSTFNFGLTAYRILKGWFTDLEITNTPTIGGSDFITTVLPDQTGYSGYFLTTDGSGTLSWAAAGGSSLTSWEENSDDLRPITTKTGALGDSTHLIEGLFIMDNGPIYVGDSQDLEIYHDSTDSKIYNNTGNLEIYNEATADIIFRVDGNYGWRIDSTGDLWPNANGSYDLGLTSYRVNKGWFTDLEITNTPTINGDDFITTVLPSQATHSGEYLTTDGAGTLSWGAISALSTWEENGNDFRPIGTGAGSIGDSSHRIDDLYIYTDGQVLFGTSDQLSIWFNGTTSQINSTTTMYITSTGVLAFNAGGSNVWAIDATGAFRPFTTNLVDIGSSTLCINDIFFGDNGTINLGDAQDATILFDGTNLAITGTGDLLYNTYTVYNSNNFDIDDHLPAQSTHSGELLTTDGAGTLSWVAGGSGTSAKLVSFYYEGTAQDEDYIVIDSTSSEGFVFDEDVTITDITIHARVAPTGANLIVYPVKNETEISASSATLTAASYIEKTDIADISMTGDSDRLGLIIKQIGSTEPGQGITVVVHYKNT